VLGAWYVARRRCAHIERTWNLRQTDDGTIELEMDANLGRTEQKVKIMLNAEQRSALMRAGGSHKESSSECCGTTADVRGESTTTTRAGGIGHGADGGSARNSGRDGVADDMVHASVGPQQLHDEMSPRVDGADAMNGDGSVHSHVGGNVLRNRAGRASFEHVGVAGHSKLNQLGGGRSNSHRDEANREKGLHQADREAPERLRRQAHQEPLRAWQMRETADGGIEMRAEVAGSSSAAVKMTLNPTQHRALFGAHRSHKQLLGGDTNTAKEGPGRAVRSQEGAARTFAAALQPANAEESDQPTQPEGDAEGTHSWELIENNEGVLELAVSFASADGIEQVATLALDESQRRLLLELDDEADAEEARWEAEMGAAEKLESSNSTERNRSHKSLLDGEGRGKDRPGRLARAQRCGAAEERRWESEMGAAAKLGFDGDERNRSHKFALDGEGRGKDRPGRLGRARCPGDQRRSLAAHHKFEDSRGGRSHKDLQDAASKDRPQRLLRALRNGEPPPNLFLEALRADDDLLLSPRIDDADEAPSFAVSAEISLASWPSIGALQASGWQRVREEAARVTLRYSREQLNALSAVELQVLAKLGVISQWTLEQLLMHQSSPLQPQPIQEFERTLADDALESADVGGEVGEHSHQTNEVSEQRQSVGAFVAAVLFAPLAALLACFGCGVRKRCIQRDWNIVQTADGGVELQIDAKLGGASQAVKLTLDAEQERALFGTMARSRSHKWGDASMRRKSGRRAHREAPGKLARSRATGILGDEAAAEQSHLPQQAQLDDGEMDAPVAAKLERAPRSPGGRSHKDLNDAMVKERPGRLRFDAKQRGADGVDPRPQRRKFFLSPFEKRGKQHAKLRLGRGATVKHFGSSSTTKASHSSCEPDLDVGRETVEPACTSRVSLHEGRRLKPRCNERPSQLQKLDRRSHKEVLWEDVRTEAKSGPGRRRGGERGGERGGGENLFLRAVQPSGMTMDRTAWVAKVFGMQSLDHGRMAKALEAVRDEEYALQHACERTDGAYAGGLARIAGSDADADTSGGGWRTMRQGAAMAKLTLTQAQLESLNVEELRAARKLGVLSEWELRQLETRKVAARCFAGQSATLPTPSCLPRPADVEEGSGEGAPPDRALSRRSSSRRSSCTPVPATVVRV
jgi:hypothetical protein